jgi:beta-galactosidase
MQNAVVFEDAALASSGPLKVGVWCDVLKPTTAEVIGRYRDDYYAGKPAVTMNRAGAGRVIYIGTVGDAAFYALVTGWLLQLAGVPPLLQAPQGVEIAERWQGDQRLLFVLNHTAQEQPIPLQGRFTDLLTGESKSGFVTLAAREVLLLSKADGPPAGETASDGGPE